MGRSVLYKRQRCAPFLFLSPQFVARRARWRNARVLTAILYLNADGTGGETDAAAPTSAHVEGGGSQGPLPSSDPSSPLAWQAERDGGV